MIFAWDPRKAASNAKKHGVTFEEAVTAVLDPLALRVPDDAHGDKRELLIGRSSKRRTLFVVLVEVRDDMTTHRQRARRDPQ